MLCTGNKKPLWTDYLTYRARPDLVLTHLGPIGIIPWRGLRKTVSDVDYGDYRNITKLHPAFLDYPTNRGHHLWYNDVEGRGSPKFNALGCSGEIRGTRGIVVLHGDALLKLWGAEITARPEKVFPFPAQLMLFTEKELGPIQPKPLSDTGERKHTKREWASMADAAADGLYTVQAGTRHTAHFEALRYWAYGCNLGGNLSTWLARVNEVSDQLHRRIPVVPSAPSYSLTQSRTNAASVATFVWSSRAYSRRDTSSEAQRRRILKRWHGSGSDMQVMNHKAMLEAIRFDYRRGLSVAEIAQDAIYSRQHIYRIVEADRAAKMRQRNDLIRDHVAGGASVSKTAAAFGVSRRQVYRTLKV